MSLVKFASKATSHNGAKLWWSRADVYGAPFRGPNAPLMPEEEYDARVVRVKDFRNNFFDISDLEQNKLYCDVMECCANGWFQLFHLERFWRETTEHYVEWLEYYLEDGSRTPFTTNGMVGPYNGQSNFFGHS